MPAAPRAWDWADARSWDAVPALGPLLRADGSGPARQATRVRLCRDPGSLYVRFDCDDRDSWGTLRRRDDPLWEEESVEVFLAPAGDGGEPPVDYFEFEVSPLGTLFDARVHNPTSRRADLVADASWDCPGLGGQAGPRAGAPAGRDWWAALAIPWAAVSPVDLSAAGAGPPRLWRANFYRIERPRGGEPEFSCWSPTLTAPADFHQPARFGILEL